MHFLVKYLYLFSEKENSILKCLLWNGSKGKDFYLGEKQWTTGLWYKYGGMVRKIVAIGNYGFVCLYELFSQTVSDSAFTDNPTKQQAGGFGSKFFDLWLLSGTLYFVWALSNFLYQDNSMYLITALV